jgi:hypothetical protein
MLSGLFPIDTHLAVKQLLDLIPVEKSPDQSAIPNLVMFLPLNFSSTALP